MKTIFIPIFYKQQARNVLETDIFKILAGRPGLRIVLFVAAHKAEYFKSQFSRPNVIVEPIPEIPEPFSFADAICHSISLNYIDSRTADVFRRRYSAGRGLVLTKYVLRRLATKIFGHARILRRASRWLDRRIVRREFFAGHFAHYRPDLVFLPHLISKYDRALLREAGRRGIATIGAVHSWDNITAVKNPIRLLPDTLIAYNEMIKSEMVRYLDADPRYITVTGLPHYDYYLTSPRTPRPEFFKRLGLDPAKRLILFGPAGGSESDTDWHIVSIIQDAIADGRIPAAQILVREHPVSAMIRGELKSSPFVHFDTPFTEFGGPGRAFREITHGDMEHLADTIFWSDVTINICSTLTIDAAAFDKPVVNVAFDGWAKKPYLESTRRFYDHDHYRPILASGGVRLVKNPDELVFAIRQYLEDPARDRDGRARIVREQCWKLDGKAGERIANLLLREMKKREKRNEGRK